MIIAYLSIQYPSASNLMLTIQPMAIKYLAK